MFKRFISLTLLWSFIVLLVSSVVLFIEPHGRVAFWSDWKLWGLSKEQWDNLHLCAGTLFSFAGLIHLYLNWQIIVAYLQKKLKGVSPIPTLLGSLFLTLIFCLSSYYQVPPMKQLIDLKEFVKQSQTRKYGNPPFGHAELVPVNRLARFLGVEPKRFIEALRKSGIQVDSGQENLKELARKAGTSPSQIFALAMKAMKDSSLNGGVTRLPKMPPPGTGRMSINDIANTYHVNVQDLLIRLKKAGIAATANETLKEIAAKAGMSPPEVYSILAEGEGN